MYKLLPILLFALLIAEENQEPNFVQSDSLDFIYAASLLDKLINEFQNQVSNIIDEDKLLIKIDKEIYDIIRADTLILDTLIKTKEKMVNNFPPENLNAWEIRNMSGPSHFIVLKLALEVNVDKSINLNDGGSKPVRGYSTWAKPATASVESLFDKCLIISAAIK